VWRYLRELALAREYPAFPRSGRVGGPSLRAIRMLAVMICPAPERHEAVVKHCMNPLIGQHVSSVTKQRLEAALPEEWLA
jgi:hypothetical protein